MIQFEKKKNLWPWLLILAVPLLVLLMYMTFPSDPGSSNASVAKPHPVDRASSIPSTAVQLQSVWVEVPHPQPSSLLPVLGSKPEPVVEIFSYACSHCFHFQESLNQSHWLEKHPQYRIHYLHSTLRPTWIPLARFFFAMQKVGFDERLHEELFLAQSRGAGFERLDANGLPETLFDWVKTKKGDAYALQIRALYGSPEIDTSIAQMQALEKDYGIPGTPSFIMKNRYRMDGLTLTSKIPDANSSVYLDAIANQSLPDSF